MGDPAISYLYLKAISFASMQFYWILLSPSNHHSII